ncbi:peptidyl-prolyl cis-trans isomerase-like 4 isoform X1 [Ranitomeya imitator]|uniref:peptidyl-prolyl cis-trans isomerase-like 4 isoform X1 n=1 Tax=Ranitomeya imitator TaxID=111125 RepID=UPI0037E7BC01
MAVLLETTLGDIVIDLYTEERPRACLNFLKLCKIKYYNYCLIHNVQRDFIIQTGDPLGTGRGGESIFSKLYGDQACYFEPEKVPRIKHKKLGTVSMVNNGNDQHGSQFLITIGENLDYLDGVHTVFGEVTEGMDVLKKINETFVDKDFVPFQDIRINHTVILDDPFDDPPDLPIPDRSPEPTKEQLDSGRIGADEEIDDSKGKSNEEIEEQLADKEAKTRAVLLEMVGDIPDADIKPPENVLFVCKLNPVTTDEDLEIIFSRFGTIKSCEIIRDWKTGESLCYAFIEFEKEEDCEKAYFKMDNVLIDDRRIHVDFSQSVAKVKWKGKGGKYTKDDFKEYEKDAGKSSKLALKDQAKPKQDSKYELVLDDDVEDTSSNQRHPSKHKKDKKRYYSDDDEDDRKMKKSKEAHHRRHEDDYCREKRRGEKKDHRRSRSLSRERSSYQSSKDKSREEARERDRERRRDRSPKHYKERSKYRERD